jgi:tetratricopeptide (TPR) repeat protein
MQEGDPMLKQPRYVEFLIGLLLLLSGCAVPVSNTAPAWPEGSYPQPEWLHAPWRVAYYPGSAEGKTFEEALDVIARYLDEKESGGAYVLDKRGTSTAWNRIRSCATDSRGLRISAVNHNDWNRPVQVDVALDDLPGFEIVVIQARENNVNYGIVVRGLIELYFHQPTHVRTIADALYLVQQRNEELRAEPLALFEARAIEYRSLSVKPAISEEQRKYIVQANALNNRKDYTGAIELYRKAVEVDPVSYPGAYFNLALLSAQVNRYGQAIAYMKKYLLLEPEAQDSRSARDKIYEWELMNQ